MKKYLFLFSLATAVCNLSAQRLPIYNHVSVGVNFFSSEFDNSVNVFSPAFNYGFQVVVPLRRVFVTIAANGFYREGIQVKRDTASIRTVAVALPIGIRKYNAEGTKYAEMGIGNLLYVYQGSFDFNNTLENPEYSYDPYLEFGTDWLPEWHNLGTFFRLQFHAGNYRGLNMQVGLRGQLNTRK